MKLELTEEEHQLLIAALSALSNRRHDQGFEFRAAGSKSAGDGALEQASKCDRLMDKVNKAHDLQK